MRNSLTVISAVLFVAVTSPVSAESPTDRNDCNSDDASRSIAGCTRIIRDARESARIRAMAYNSRGLTYRIKMKNSDLAIADYTESLKLFPHPMTYYNRGLAYGSKGDLAREIADYTDSIRLRPSFDAHITRGLRYLYGNSSAKAQADFQQANGLDPSDAYAVLLLDLAMRRNNMRSSLAQMVTPLDMNAWPAPIVRLYLGELTEGGAFSGVQQDQACEVAYYAGELTLLQGAKTEALRLFQRALEDCSPATKVDSIQSREWLGANARLRELGAQPARANEPRPSEVGLVARGNQPTSFDCARANEPMEYLICADAELASWDVRLAASYKQQLARLSASDVTTFRQEQRRWIMLRNSTCNVPRKGNVNVSDLAPAKSCVLEMTQRRVGELSR